MKWVEPSGEKFQQYLNQISIINSHLKKLKNETGGYSTHYHVVEHPEFKTLVALGDKIIPYIMYLMLEEGSDWVYILLLKAFIKPSIFPKEHEGVFIKMTIDALQWYVESDYYKNDDIYHGLVE